MGDTARLWACLSAATVTLAGLAGTQLANASVSAAPVTLHVDAQLPTGVVAPGAATIVVTAGGTTNSCATACDIPVTPGADVKLAATVSTGYGFQNWSDPLLCSVQQPSCSFAMPGQDTTVAAVVQTETSTLTVVPGSAGVITGGGGGINCTRDANGNLLGSCAATFPRGSTVALTVNPASGRHLVRWSIWQCGRSRTCNVPLPSDTTITALLSPVLLTVDRVGPYGAVTGRPGGLLCAAPCQHATATVPMGTSVTLDASQAAGQTFGQWGTPCGGPIPTCTLSLYADSTVTAAFATAGAPVAGLNPITTSGVSAACGSSAGQLTNYTFTVTVTPGGTVSYSGPGNCRTILCVPSCSRAGYSQAQPVALHARPSRGYRFAGWRPSILGRNSTLSVPVIAYSWVRAQFTRSGRRRR